MVILWCLVVFMVSSCVEIWCLMVIIMVFDVQTAFHSVSLGLNHGFCSPTIVQLCPLDTIGSL